MSYFGNNKIFNITSKGDSCFIRYSAHADGTDFTKTWSEGQSYIGIATAQVTPTDKSGYVWCRSVGGKSAYDIACELENFQGTEQEWLESLKGADGKTPYIKNGTWWIDKTDTGVKAEGKDGADGKTPYIQDGYWYIDGVNTNVKAEGVDGKDYVLTEADKIEIAGMIVEMLGGSPVYAVINENNIVTIKGLSENKNYTIKYEMEDGSVLDIGELTLAEEEPDEPTQSYTNLLPSAIDASGNLYVGDNGEKGYKSNCKISVSSGNESSADACVSGFIELPEGKQSQIRIKNITLSSSASVNNFVFYDASKTKMSGYAGAGTAGAFHSDIQVTDGIYLFRTANWFTDDNTPRYFRFSCDEITDETIVTINEEIV